MHSSQWASLQGPSLDTSPVPSVDLRSEPATVLTVFADLFNLENTAASLRSILSSHLALGPSAYQVHSCLLMFPQALF